MKHFYIFGVIAIMAMFLQSGNAITLCYKNPTNSNVLPELLEDGYEDYYQWETTQGGVTVRGIAICGIYYDGAERLRAVTSDDSVNTNLTASSSCFCKAAYPFLSDWENPAEYADHAECLENCASDCSERSYEQKHDSNGQGPCPAGTYAITIDNNNVTLVGNKGCSSTTPWNLGSVPKCEGLDMNWNNEVCWMYNYNGSDETGTYNSSEPCPYTE